MIPLTYRHAQLADLGQIVEIYNSTIASRMVTADTEALTVESKQNWYHQHNTTNRPLWVIENTIKQIIGWVSFQSFYGRPAYEATIEISIYLDQNHRGKGIGKQVLQYCIAQAPALGVKTILGYIFSHNLPSFGLFRYCGFDIWATLPNIALLDGQERSLNILGKRIA
jgi:L-amino acid N-acyltransferase YncA